MRTHNISPCYRKVKEILIMPPDLALLSALIGSNYPCLELIFMVPKVFEPLKFDCILTCTKAGFGFYNDDTGLWSSIGRTDRNYLHVHYNSFKF